MPEDLSNARLSTTFGTKYSAIAGPQAEFGPYGEIRNLVVDYRLESDDVLEFLDEMFPCPEKKGDVVSLRQGGILHTRKEVFLATAVSLRSFNESKPWNFIGLDTKAPAGTYESDVIASVTFLPTINSYNGKLIRTNKEPEFIVEEKFSATVEMLAVQPNKNITLGGEQPKDLSIPLVKLIPIVEMSYRWDWAIDPDFDTITSVIGKVNVQTEEKFLGKPKPGTVLFLGYQATPRYHYTTKFESTEKVWTIEYKFAKRLISEEGETYGWNHAYDTVKGKFVSVKRKVEGAADRDLYAATSFAAQLFKVINTD